MLEADGKFEGGVGGYIEAGVIPTGASCPVCPAMLCIA